MINQKGKKSTVKEIRNSLIYNENMSLISGSSVKRILKNKLGNNFKRINTLEYYSIKPFNIP